MTHLHVWHDPEDMILTSLGPPGPHFFGTSGTTLLWDLREVKIISSGSCHTCKWVMAQCYMVPKKSDMCDMTPKIWSWLQGLLGPPGPLIYNLRDHQYISNKKQKVMTQWHMMGQSCVYHYAMIWLHAWHDREDDSKKNWDLTYHIFVRRIFIQIVPKIFIAAFPPPL